MSRVVREERLSSDDPWGWPLIAIRVSETFEEFAARNPDLRIEQSSNGEILFMSPTGGESGCRNAEIIRQLGNWTMKYGGRSFDSSVVFCLPDKSKKSPDASWLAAERWTALSKEERKSFPPICPDFVIELRSESDRLLTLQEKLQSYLDNGIRLGWIIDPLMGKVHIYRPMQAPEIVNAPMSISGEDVLPGFVLDLAPVWGEA